jgi:hypothetical protein
MYNLCVLRKLKKYNSSYFVKFRKNKCGKLGIELGIELYDNNTSYKIYFKI